MKKFIVVIVVLVVIGGGVLWIKKPDDGSKADAKPAAEKPAEDAGAATKISRDENGNVVIAMDEKVKEKNGINVTKIAPAQLNPETKGFGRVLNPAPLAAAVTELATTEAAETASSNELARLRVLAGQGNASTRALQTAEAAALHDQLAARSAKDRLALSWGSAIKEQHDLPAFINSLTSLDAALVRVDLPAGEALKSTPGGARLVSLSGNSMAAEFLGAASNVDPQTQGQGYLFLVQSNQGRLTPGEAVTARIKFSGEPLTGVIIPRDAVVRTEGAAWVYLLQTNAADFIRTSIDLDRPAGTGWFVTNGVMASNYVVIRGAQMLLSEELKGSIKPD